MYEETPYASSLALGVFVKIGSRDESASHAGYCHFLEHMLFKDTSRRTAKEQAEAIERVGGVANAATSREYTCFHATLGTKHAELGFDLLSDMMFRPLLQESDIKTEKEVILEELVGYEDSPEDYIHDFYYDNLFPSHPLGRDILGTRESLEGVNQSTLTQFYRDFYSTERMVISGSGKLSFQEFCDLSEKYFSSKAAEWKPLPPRKVPELSFSFHAKERDLEQVYLLLGGAGFARDFHTATRLSLMSHILGGGMASRLFQRIREEEGLCYSISAFHSSYADVGITSIDCSTSRAKLETCLELIAEELHTVTRDGFTRKEVEDAISNHVGSLSIGYELPESRMNNIALQEIYYGKYYDLETRIREVESVTLEELNQILRECWGIPKMHLSLLGSDLKLSSSLLEKFGLS